MKHLLPALLLALAALPAAAQGTDTLITITASAPRASNRCGAQEADFSLRAERDLTLEQRTITGYNDGFTYGKRTSSAMKRGDTQKLNVCISEGIPALEICAKADGQEKCWTPAYSGEDGSLVLAPGFASAPAQGAGTLITIDGGAVRSGDSCGRADFTLRAERPLTLVQRTINEVNDDGTPTYGSSTSSAMKRGDTQKLTACTYDDVLEICATPEGGGKEQCWRPFNSRYSLTVAPGFALAAAPASLDAAALQGAWDDKVSGRCHMSIVRTRGDEVEVRVNWADGAAVDNVWTFSGRWDKAQQQLAYTDGLRVRRESQDGGKTTETVQWSGGTGTLRYEGGALYWHDAKEQVCKECIFQRGNN